ncbi:MAG: 2-dehydropantoate 2-reductase [Chloroflexota bacterium]
MRIIIYGAGAIGGVIGGHLARSGQDVVFIGRQKNVDAINLNGLRLVTYSQTYTLPVAAVTSPAELEITPDDVVFLSVKGQNTEETLRDLQAVNRDVPVFCFQNGIRNEEIASGYFPRVYGVMVRVGATYLKDGEVESHHEPNGWLLMGRYPRGTDALVEAVAEKLRAADFYVKVSDDVMPYKWGKLLANLSNGVRAICDCTEPEVAPVIDAAREELRGLLQEAGIPWKTDKDLAREWDALSVPTKGNFGPNSKGSGWQSLARQSGGIEVDFLNGEAVRLAQKLHRTAPVNEKVIGICKEMARKREVPGKYTPDQLAALVGLKLPG